MSLINPETETTKWNFDKPPSRYTKFIPVEISKKTFKEMMFSCGIIDPTSHNKDEELAQMIRDDFLLEDFQ